jgi:hypothetical protein
MLVVLKDVSLLGGMYPTPPPVKGSFQILSEVGNVGWVGQGLTASARTLSRSSENPIQRAQGVRLGSTAHPRFIRLLIAKVI